VVVGIGVEHLLLLHRNPVLGIYLVVAEYPANGMKLAHRAGGHSWGENADMSSLKRGVLPLRRKQKGFICKVYTNMTKVAASKAGGKSLLPMSHSSVGK
jgi:hypothetical protein